MKFLFDFFPILAFFIAFKMTSDSEEGIYVATSVLIICSFIQVAIYWLMYRRFEKMHLITLAVVIVFGSATLLLHDERFIKWKPTVVMWIFALVAFGSEYIGKKNLFHRMMHYADDKISVPDFVWYRLNLGLVLFFVFIGAANLYVAFNFDRSTWVDFKTFGIMGLNLVFMAGMMFYLFRFIEDPEKLLSDKSDTDDVSPEE
ncbi:MAG: septation protein A [Proteobacteria bacterium]|nr:septation protein A [Pseudomonadota bacterium]NOG59619.1 septation protein A [Pseudomonadota bacterium]